MTEAHEPNDLDGPHEGPIKTPRQLVFAVLWAFVVPIFGIVLLVMYVTNDQRPSAGTDALGPDAVAARVRPVGQVEIKDASDVSSLKTGEQVFAGQCSACHAAGVLGSPKLGDASAWAPRITTGYEALLHSALAGKGQMPPQGGGDYNDFEIGRAVVYMANRGGAKFAEPAMPAASAAMATAGGGEAGAATPAGAPIVDAPVRADANAGRPEERATTGLNAQVQSTPPNAVPGGVAAAAQPTLVAAAATPPALYGQICSACHAAGVAGAPKLGDKTAWAPRIGAGIDALTASAIKGKGVMPPRGGSQASDADIKAVVTYMVGSVK